MSPVLIVTIAIVAWLTAAATALRSASRIWLRHWVEQRLSGASTAALYLDRPHRMLLAASTGVSLTVFTAGLVIGRDSESWWTTLLRMLGYSITLLVAAQLLPRAIGRRWPTKLVPILLPPVRVLDVVFAPLLNLVRRITGERRLEEVRGAESEDDALDELLREGELEGVGDRTEIAIISGVVQFGEKQISDVMTPRADIFAVDASLPPDELARRLAQSGFSRVPLYDGDIDHIVGMVHVFDVIKAEDANVLPRRPVALARPSAGCNELLFRMLRERMHLAVVSDDAGRTVGIVTLEDLLEELVGDIRDEHDEPAETLPARPA